MTYLKVKKVSFFSEIKNFNEPILIKNGCHDMKAIKKWNYNYLKNKFKDNVLPVEVYSKRKDMEQIVVKDKRDLKMDIFFDKLFNNDPPYLYFAELELENYRKILDKDLFLDVSSYMDVQLTDLNHNLLFIGNNSKSGCHIHVTGDYILNQVTGTKIVYIFDYNENYVQSRGLFNETSNFSKENFFKMDHSGKKIYKVILTPGDSLFIPPWWWHAVEGIGFSCSVTKVYTRNDYKYLNWKPFLILLFIKTLFEGYKEIFLTNLIDKVRQW